jgi:hypothetical protein
MGLGGAIVGAAAGAAMNAVNAQAELKRRLVGRTPEQQEVIKYFLKGEGCLSKNITDEEYETRIRNRVNSLNIKAKALSKIGIDESQVNEIPPVCFEGYVFNDKKALTKTGKDRDFRSSVYQVSWIFFSNNQVHAYQNTFSMEDDGKKETTEEYFYKDITNFSTKSDTADISVVVEKGGCLSKKLELVPQTVEIEHFSLASAGGGFTCSMNKKQDTEGVIQAMKAKLREKKQ